MTYETGHYTALGKGDSSLDGCLFVHSTDPLALIEEIMQLFQSFEKRIISLREHQASLEHRVQTLTLCEDSYKPLRNRFISTFKRDILGNATSTDLGIIGEGNQSAECGDAIADAALYTDGGERSDAKTYTSLYGLHPLIVSQIRHQETIDILNAHATTIACKEKTVSDEFHRRFAHFITVFTEHGDGFEQGYLSGYPTEVTDAYWEFMRCLNTEVRWVGDSD